MLFSLSSFFVDLMFTFNKSNQQQAADRQSPIIHYSLRFDPLEEPAGAGKKQKECEGSEKIFCMLFQVESFLVSPTHPLAFQVRGPCPSVLILELDWPK